MWHLSDGQTHLTNSSKGLWYFRTSFVYDFFRDAVGFAFWVALIILSILKT